MNIGGLNIENVGDGVSLATLIHIKSGAGAGASHDNIVCKDAGSEVFSIDVNGLPTWASTNGDYYQYTTCNIGDVVADSDAISPAIFYCEAACTLISIGISVDTDVGDDNVNYQSIQFTDSDDNGILSAAFTTDIAWTAGVVQDCGALDGTNKVLVADDYIKMTFTKAASGKAFSGMTVHLKWFYAA